MDERAHDLVRRHGWNTTCSQILNPGIEHWFAPEDDAMVGYVRDGGVRVVVGGPVCAEDRLEEVVEAWHADADRARDGVCYFGAEARIHGLLAGREGFATVVLGAQPVWSPASFLAACEGRRSLRYQLQRARNKGVTVEECPAGCADDPRLWRILDEWLATRGLPAMRFMVEPRTLAHLADRRLFVARRGGDPVGFVVMSPALARRAWLTEQFPRGHGAPNGTVELALAEAVRAVAPDADSITMGIVPLSRRAGEPVDHPAWLRLVTRWARAHGHRFYDFDGLDEFKGKFAPDRWDPIYVISRERRFSPRTLWAVAGAFSDGSPVAAVLKGLGRAARQEWRWLRS